LLARVSAIATSKVTTSSPEVGTSNVLSADAPSMSSGVVAQAAVVPGSVEWNKERDAWKEFDANQVKAAKDAASKVFKNLKNIDMKTKKVVTEILTDNAPGKLLDELLDDVSVVAAKKLEEIRRSKGPVEALRTYYTLVDEEKKKESKKRLEIEKKMRSPWG